MTRRIRTRLIIGMSSRSMAEAVRDGMARAARAGATWSRIIAVSARSSDGRGEHFRVRLVIGLQPA